MSAQDKTYQRAIAANPFTPDSESGRAWLLGAIWGDEERVQLREIINDLQTQLEHRPTQPSGDRR